MSYLMGIDNGGTFVKAGIVDENGNILAVAKEPVHNLTPQPGFTEREMEELWNQNAKVIRRALATSQIPPEEIKGLSFSGHGKGLYLIDREGRPAYRGILSTDTRAWEYIKRWEQDGTKEKVYQKTFQDILACQPVSLLAWLKEHEPQAYESVQYVFSVNDYIRFRLTGQANGEYTALSGGNLVNLNTFQYDRELMELFGLGEIYSKLPPLVYSGELCGTVTEEAAGQTGLSAGTKVAAGMFDVDACGLAAGLDHEEPLCMIAGTWSINEYIVKAPITNGTVALNSMYCIPGYFLIEESSPTSAGNMEWFINQFLSHEKESSNIYELTNRWVEETDPKENKIIFLPFLNGSNEDPLARGTWIGLTDFNTKAHMIRAVYEGIVFSHITHVKRLLQNRKAPNAIRLAGGAANSSVWVQIFADALQIPIETVICKEQGILGAAIAAGVGTGVFQDYQEATAKTVQVRQTVWPRQEYAKIYQEKYERYQKVIRSLSGVWKEFQ
ncbi:MAG: carbohydrate kinase [Coprococcus sp.]|nr:carbohydrate kinase [Coprococcus sp.]